MADNVQIGIEGVGQFDSLEKALTSAITRALASASKSIVSEIGRAFKKLEGNIDFGRAMENETKQALRGTDRLQKSFDALAASSAGISGSFGEAFDPRVIRAFDDQLERVVELQEQLAKGAGTLPSADYKRLVDQTKLLATGLISARNAAESAKRAIDESNRNVSRDGRQVSREKIATVRAESARFAVEQQRQASAARDASRQAVESTRASSRQRVAIIQGAARTIATLERGLSNAFRGTAAAIGGAFKGLGATVGGVAAGLRRSVSNTTNQISNDYSKSFRQSTRTVQNETRQQASVINNFAREARASISSIGSGALGGGAKFGLGAAIGGILGVGAAKAFSGGFNRATILENSERALTKLLGTAEKAKTLLDQVTEVVTGTPFRLDQFAAGATQLLAFNVQAEKIPEVLRTISDAAALSIDPDQTVDRLIRTFGQIQAAGKLATEDINQLTEAGVPAWALLGNQLGKTTLEMRDLVTEGAVPASQAIDLLLNGIQNGTDGINGTTVAFAGLSKELGTTLKGSLANFNTSISRLGANIITAFREPFTAALAAGTAAVDLLGSALKILAVNIQQSLAFKVVQQGLVRLTQALKDAKTELAPFFNFLSGGIVLAGQFALAFVALKSIPGVLKAIGSAIKFILAPQRLLIAGVILAASYFKKLYDESQSLRDAFGELFGVLGRIATVVKDLVVDAFGALFGASQEAASSVGGFAESVLGVVIPALEKLSTFLLEKVLPPIRNFARFVRTEVLPVLGDVLANAIEFAKAAFAALVEFIQNEVIPVVGPILKKAVEIGRDAFEAMYDFLSGTFIPFIQNNLTPVLAGIGVALGTLALSGGNIPLAGLAGITAGLAAALSNDDIRNALIDNISKAVDTVKEKLGNLFDGDTLKRIGVGVLKAARKIGEVLGNVFTDPRLLAGVAGVAAAAAAVGAAFALGLVEGIASNLPAIVEGLRSILSAAFQAAFSALASNLKLAALLVSVFAGAGVIAAIALAGRRIGKTFATGVQTGLTRDSFQQSGGNFRDFASSLFGGPGAISKGIEREYQKATATAVREGQRLQRVIQSATGSTARGESGRFLKPTDVAAIDSAYQQLTQRLSTTQLAAANVRAGVGQLGDAFRKGTPFVANFTDGLRSVGSGLKQALPALGTAAGTIAGGLFAASFVSKALFDINSSGKEKIQSALGTIAIGAGVGAELGGAQGAAAGAGLGAFAAAVGFLSTAFRENERSAEAAAAGIRGYLDAIAGLSGAGAEAAILNVLKANVAGASEDIQTALGLIEFKYQDVLDIVESGNISAGLGDFRSALEASGVSGDRLNDTMAFLENQIRDIGRADQLANIRDRFEKTGPAVDVVAQSVLFFKQRVEELNQIRIDGFKAKVDEAKTKLDDAGSAADEAKAKLIAFLSGEGVTASIEGQVADATIAIGGLGTKIAELDLASAVGNAEFTNAIETAKTDVAGILAAAKPLTLQEAAALVAPLKTAAEESGAGGALVDTINTALADYFSNPGQKLTADLIDAEALKTELQTKFDSATGALETALAANPLTIPLLLEIAQTDTIKFGEEAAAGLEKGLENTDGVKAASKALGDAIKEEIGKSLDTGSPSKETEKLGKFAVDGLVKGMRATTPVFGAGLAVGKAAMAGVNVGLMVGSGAVYRTIRSIGARMISELKSELIIESPSQAMAEVGNQTVAGFIVGVDESLPLIDRIAFSAATRISSKFKQVGARAAQAIGIGFAEEGIGFAGSVAGALDDAASEALSRVDQFKAIGQAIGTALFGSQGSGPLGVTGGGSLESALQKSFLAIVDNAAGLAEKIQAQFDEVIGKDKAGKDIVRGKAGFTLDINNPIGRENRTAFIDAGLNVRKYAEELLAAGRSIDSVIFETKAYRDQIVNIAKWFGLSDVATKELINTLGLADDQLRSYAGAVDATAKASQAAADEARNAIAAAEAAAEAEKQRQRNRTVEDNRFAVGSIGSDEYIQILNRRLAEQEQFSDEWTSIWKEIQSITEQTQRTIEEASKEAQRAAEESLRAAEEAQRKEEERRRQEYTLARPAFRDLVVQSPSGDPEAVALATANRVAFAIRR